SKKYRAARVATTLTEWPARRSCRYSSGTRMAATEPVAPRRTLDIGAPRVQMFHDIDNACGQVAPADALIAALDRPEVSPLAGPFERVGHHQVGRRMPARALRNVQKSRLVDGDFELELHQDAAETPVGADAVDQLRRPHQAQ